MSRSPVAGRADQLNEVVYRLRQVLEVEMPAKRLSSDDLATVLTALAVGIAPSFGQPAAFLRMLGRLIGEEAGREDLHSDVLH